MPKAFSVAGTVISDLVKSVIEPLQGGRRHSLETAVRRQAVVLPVHKLPRILGVFSSPDNWRRAKRIACTGLLHSRISVVAILCHIGALNTVVGNGNVDRIHAGCCV
jgi:hypothetical protein